MTVASSAVTRPPRSPLVLPLRNTRCPTAGSPVPVIRTPLPSPTATTSAPSPASPSAYATREKSSPGKLPATVVPICRSPAPSPNQTEPVGPQWPAVSTKSLVPSVTLNPAEQRPAVDRIGSAPFRRVVKVPPVRSVRTNPPMLSATPVSRDQSDPETVRSPRTTTSFAR